jgi:hypothetical protein
MSKDMKLIMERFRAKLDESFAPAPTKHNQDAINVIKGMGNMPIKISFGMGEFVARAARVDKGYASDKHRKSGIKDFAININRELGMWYARNVPDVDKQKDPNGAPQVEFEVVGSYPPAFGSDILVFTPKGQVVGAKSRKPVEVSPEVLASAIEVACKKAGLL